MSDARSDVRRFIIWCNITFWNPLYENFDNATWSFKQLMFGIFDFEGFTCQGVNCNKISAIAYFILLNERGALNSLDAHGFVIFVTHFIHMFFTFFEKQCNDLLSQGRVCLFLCYFS